MTGPWQGAAQARKGPGRFQGDSAGQLNRRAAVLLWNNSDLAIASSWGCLGESVRTAPHTCAAQ